MKKIYFLSILICIISCNSDEKNFVKETENNTLELDSLVRYGKLDNGFTYYLRDNNSETTELRMVVKAGSYHQDGDQANHAHLTEHVAYKYPKHFPNDEKYFRSSGRYKHAGTGNLHTFYYARIPSVDKEGINNGVQLLRDWAQDFLLDQNLIDVERNAVIAEGRATDPHRNWWSDKVDSVIVANTGFPMFDRAKLKLSMENFDRDAFLRFKKDWYRPDLEAAIIVGDINVDSLEMEIQEMFSDLKMPEDPRMDASDKLAEKRVHLPGQNQFVKLLDTVKPDFRLEFFSKRKNRAYAPRNRSDFKQMVLQDLYEHILSMRGPWVEEQYDAPIANFLADFGTTAGNKQLFRSGIVTNFKNDDQNYLKDRFQSALMTWKRLHNGLTESELEKAKKTIFDEYNYGESGSSILAKKYEDHFVSGIPALSPEKEKEMILALMDEISLDDIQKFTLDYGDLSKNMDFIFVTDGNNKIPSKKTLKVWLSEVIQQDVEPLRQPERGISTLTKTVKLPEQPSISVRTDKVNVIGINTITFTNGTKLILKPVKLSSGFNSNTIQIKAIRPNRAPLNNREEYVLAQVIPEVTEYMGAGSYNKFELEKFKRDKALSLRFFTDKDYQTVEASSKTQDLEELLSLIYLYIDKPRYDSEAFEAWKRDKMEQVNGNSGLTRANKEFVTSGIEEVWYPDIPRLLNRDLKAFTLNKITKGRKKWFSDFSGYTFIVTGDFETEKLKPILTNYVSKFPFNDTGYKSKLPDFDFPFRKMDDTIRLKNSDQAYVRLYFPLKVSTDVKTQVKLKLVGKALHARIWERLRDGCYSPRAWGEWQNKDKGIYSFNIDFDTNLGDEDRMLKMAMEEFSKLRKEGVDQSWLDREIKNEQLNFNRQLNSFSLIINFWANEIQENLKNETDLEERILKYETILKNFVSLEEMNEAARKYLRKNSFQKFMIFPKNYKKSL